MSNSGMVEQRRGLPNVTQIALARQGLCTPEMVRVAEQERLEVEFVRQQVAAGRLIIPANIEHGNLEPIGIGRAVRCKVNANIGSSPASSGLEDELCKLAMAIRCGADTVMDLSTGKQIDAIRSAILARTKVPLGTVPIYQMAESVEAIEELHPDDMLAVIEQQARQGVDYMTIHAGLLARMVPLARQRLLGIVSRGGSLIARWMARNERENPFFTNFEEICRIFQRYDVAFSLGDGLRPGCLADATDRAQLAELEVLGQLTRKAWVHDVQVMVEGPGHVPFDQIRHNMELEQRLCDDAPFYVLGPVVTDIAPGYDHISSAIGATMAAFCGASMLCYVTPREHLGLPDVDDVRQGVIAYRIAAHAADIALGRPGARERDDAISRARIAFDWEQQFALALDPPTARRMWEECWRRSSIPPSPGATERYCTMCGEKFCAIRNTQAL